LSEERTEAAEVIRHRQEEGRRRRRRPAHAHGLAKMPPVVFKV